MKLLSCVAIIAAIVAAANAMNQQACLTSINIRVMSYNVRYDSMPDVITVQETIHSLTKALPKAPTAYHPELAELPWSTRRIYIANDILSANAHVYGGQELLRRQVDDLQELLGDNWAWMGVGRDDGNRSGEYSAIFYRRDIFRLDDWETFWLSSTPFEVSKYPDAGSRRICTAAHFSVIDTQCDFCETGGTSSGFTLLNTHLDDQSSGQRQLGASLVLHRAKYEAIKTRRPVLLTGDFNSPTNDSAYQVVTGQTRPIHLNQTFIDRYAWTSDEEKGFEDFTMRDLLGAAPPHRRSGHYATFTDFVAVNDTTAFERLDYVFVGSTDGWNATAYRVGSNIHDDGVYASDHRPVYADISIHTHCGTQSAEQLTFNSIVDESQLTFNKKTDRSEQDDASKRTTHARDSPAYLP